MRLIDLLKEYGKSDAYAFHMPGHKRNSNLVSGDLPFSIDITEIDGFDDLHHPEGVLKEAQERAAKLYCAEETHFLVNGSTVGILSAILGTTQRGDKVLIARNCHKSVYHALELHGLEGIYVYPDFDADTGLNGAISPRQIEAILSREPEIKAIVIVSPTYDGVLSDVRQIAEIAHRYQIPLIVDEAHGAHFGFHKAFPQNANVNGADIVIHSVHKTLPAMTQTALLHMNGELVNREGVRKHLHMLQSSSPSYVLMASIDACMDFLEKEGKSQFEIYTGMLYRLRTELKKLTHLRLVDAPMYDDSKIVISVQNTNISSRELTRRLREEYQLEPEMTAGNYVLLMTSVGDTQEGFDRLAKALTEIDGTLAFEKDAFIWEELPRPTKEGKGNVASTYLYLYPPGYPIVCPGEVITEEVRAYLEKYRAIGFSIVGEENE